jgi:hypothetical protein
MKINFNKFLSYSNYNYGLGYVSMNILSSEKEGINVNCNDIDDAHIIMPKELLSNFKNIIKDYNVAEKNIFIWDYNGNIINKYTKDRLNNDSGNVEIKVDSGLISDIIINKDIDAKNSKIYIVITKYDEYFNLISDYGRQLLLNEDFKKFLDINDLFLKCDINFIITPKVEKSGLKITINNNHHFGKCKTIEEKDINKYLAEIIFGKMCYGNISNCQVNLKLDNCQIEEIYRIDKNINVDFSPRSNGIIEIYSKSKIKNDLEFFIVFKLSESSQTFKLSNCSDSENFIDPEDFNINILNGLEFSVLETILSDYSFYEEYNKLTYSEKVQIYGEDVLRDKIFNYMFNRRNEVKTSNYMSKNIVKLGNNIYKKILNNILRNSTLGEYNDFDNLVPIRTNRNVNFNNCYNTSNSMLKRGCSNGFELTNNFREMEL